MEAARQGPAAQVIPVLIPVQAGFYLRRKFVFAHTYL